MKYLPSQKIDGADDLLQKLSFTICDLKTVIYFLKMTNVIRIFPVCAPV